MDVDDNCEVDLVLAFAVKATGAKDSKPFIRFKIPALPFPFRTQQLHKANGSGIIIDNETH